MTETVKNGYKSFKYVQNTNSWDEAIQAKTIITLLEEEALMTYLEMLEDDKKDVKKIVEAEFFPTKSSFRLLQDFESQKLLPHQSPRAFLFNLKKLLDQALPGQMEMQKTHFS